MNCIDIKMEKANAMLRYKRLEKITALFRLMEVCIFLFIISSLSTHLPTAFKLSADCFRRLYITICSPAFLFILGNAIVLVLFFKSGHLSPQETKNFSHALEFCTQYVESCVNHMEEVEKHGQDGNCQDKEAVSDICSFEDKKMMRSHSERLMRYQHRHFGKKLRPTVTENARKTGNHGERAVESAGMIRKSDHHRVSAQNFSPKCYAEDEMSGEEFRHAVEAFIARQQKFLREEFSSIVAYGS